jgi:hypothetical protein
MNVKHFFFSILIFGFCACDNQKQDADATNTNPVHTNNNSKKRVKDIEPALWKADSLQVLYYDDPDGDSLKYSRYFTYALVSDSVKIGSLLKEIDQPFIEQSTKRNCRSEGKFYLLRGEDILKTIYFSTRGDSCSYMYFIKDGAFIYFSLTQGAERFLSESRRVAKKPS